MQPPLILSVTKDARLGVALMTNAPTGAIALADGPIFWGPGHGASGIAAGELCFNTAITGYQEILTDPSYAEQIVLFTFPHIGNVGANPEDQEESAPQGEKAARGAVVVPPPAAAAVQLACGGPSGPLAPQARDHRPLGRRHPRPRPPHPRTG